LTHAAPTAPAPPNAANFNDFPQVADVLPSYTAVLGGRHARGAVPAGATGRRTPSSFASTVRPALPALAVLLLLAAAACAARALRLHTTSARGTAPAAA
jgi:hypothetical protein